MEYQDHGYKAQSVITMGMEEFLPYFMYSSEEINASNIDYYWKQISYFTRMNYVFDDRYILSGQFRRDGNSTLSERNKFGNFWSVGASWNLHNESFIPDLFSNFSLRGSYGVLGNIPYADQWGSQYDALASVIFSNNNDWGENNGTGGISTPGNAGLIWEESKHLDIGLDLGFWGNRLKITADYYNKITDHAIISMRGANETGYLGSFNGNGAKLNNKGVELSIDAIVFDNKNFRWNAGVNGSFQETYVDELYQDLLTFAGDTSDGSNEFVALAPGHLLGEYYTVVWAGLDENGNALYWTDETMTETTDVRQDAKKIWMGKNSFPRYMANFTSDLTFFKNWNLSFMFSGQFDFYVHNGVNSYTFHDGRFPTRNQVKEALYDSWTDAPGMENHNAQFPRAILGNPSESRLESSRFMSKGDHIRLKELKLSYSFGEMFKNQSGIRNLTVYFRGTNLWTHAFDKGLKYDPESIANTWSWIGKGRYWYSSPILRTYSIGIQIDF